MTYQDKLDLLRSEDIKARFLLYGHTVFALHCRVFWVGFNPHTKLAVEGVVR